MINKKDILKNVFKNKEALQKSVTDKNKTYTRDETYWVPPWDNTKKVGIATIAFLPFGNMFDEENKELSPFIFTPVHNNMTGKKGKKYYNIACPSGKNPAELCPICDKFFEFYNNSEEDKNLVKSLRLGRQRFFCSNIIVLKNDSNPEEVGKIFKWRFGVSIQAKITSKINPIDGDEPIMIHDPYGIVPFKVKIIEKNSYRNYDTSEWGSPGKTLADYIIPNESKEAKEKYIDNICDSLYRTTDFITDKDYRSEQELNNILNDILEANNLCTVKPNINENSKIVEKETIDNVGKELDIEEQNEDDDQEESSNNFPIEDIFND